ncbi:regulator of chromosome condensation 1/beta-lactamase-inhibitor protein II [Coemansia mojavensis]|nr:regulator of chromosome condensation 1/beta-lactamase-inhibitor protein II [Coemansia mojavensis]
MRHALVAAVCSSSKQTFTKLAGFGLNASYQLGWAHSNQAPVVSVIDGQVLQIACGREHSAMVVRRADGTRRVLVCGNNAYGQLGIGKVKQGGELQRWEIHELSALNDLLDGEEPVKVQCGLDHTVVLTSAGRVFAMGWGDDGQLGTGVGASSNRPVQVAALDNVPIVNISSSTDFTLALSADNRLFYWGNAEYGQCMVGEKRDRVLLRIEVPFEQEIADIAAGGCHSLLLTRAGQVYMCGYGALGLGEHMLSVLRPTLIEGLDNITAIYASTDRSLAISTDHRVFSWGLANAAGRLGDGSENLFEPRMLDIDPELVDPKMTAVGNDIALIASKNLPSLARG